MLLTQVDDRVVLDKLRLYHQQLIKGQDIDKDEVLNEALAVLSSSKFSTATKKVASQVKNIINPTKPNDWITMATFVGSCCSDSLVKFIKHWLSVSSKYTIGQSDSEFLFLSDFILRAGKVSKELLTVLDRETLYCFREKLLLVSFTLFECRDEDVTHLVKSVLKLYSTDEERKELVLFLLDQFPRDSPCAVFTLGLLCDHALDQTLKHRLLTNLFFWALNQELASLTSGVFCTVFSDDSLREQVVEIIVKLLLSNRRCVRNNLVRVWLPRITVSKKAANILKQSLERIENEWQKHKKGEGDLVWPLHIWKYQDVTCIDLEWQWSEAEYVMQPRDNIIVAYASICLLLSRRFKNYDFDKKMLKQALFWPLSEASVPAFQTFCALPSSESKTEPLEQFFEANCHNPSEDIRKEIDTAFKAGYFSEACRKIWNERPEMSLPCNDVNSDTMADEWDCTQKVVHHEKIMPNLNSTSEKILHLLYISGSHSDEICPTFPVLYENLLKANIHHRAFANELNKLIDHFKNSDETLRCKISLIWKVVTRCRMKAVVDHGCSTLGVLLPQDYTLLNFFFNEASAFLFSESTAVRTLCISRVLWCCCSAAGPELYKKLWNQIVEFIDSPQRNPTVMSRVLKTLKLFFSKADCAFPLESYTKLFSFCIAVQINSDFLVRSSATILFGFIIKAITGSRSRPLFYLTVKWPDIWKQVKSLLEQPFENWILPKKILFLTFLSQFYVCNEQFYTCHEYEIIRNIRDLVNTWINISPNIRERRFCIDVLINFIPIYHREIIFSTVKTNISKCNANSYYDSEYFIDVLKEDPTIRTGENMLLLPSQLLKSAFVRRVNEASTLESSFPSPTFMEEFELILQKAYAFICDERTGDDSKGICASYMLVLLARCLKLCSVSSNIKEQYKNAVNRCLMFGDRARHVLSVLPIELGLTDSLLNSYHFIQLIKEWD